MSRKLRFVFDTSALVGRAFFAARQRGEVLLSSATAEELAAVLGRKKFDSYVTREERDAFLDKFIASATMLENIAQITACRDPKDDMFLSLGRAGSSGLPSDG